MLFKTILKEKILPAIILLMISTSSLLAQYPRNTDLIIHDKFITYDENRIHLSLEYLKKRYGIIQNTPTIKPRMIVLHYTGGGTLQSNFNYFNKSEIENARAINKNQSTLNVSSHFLIDKDGTIYRLMKEESFARHIIGLNYLAIGVENVGSKDNPLTQAQITANINLVKYLCGKYKIEYLIGHSEYTAFRNSELWKETDPAYITYKTDPGELFMKEVRKGVSTYQLKQKP